MALQQFPGMVQDWYPLDRRLLGGSVEKIDIYQVPGEDSVLEILFGGHVWFKERTGSKTVTRVGFLFAGTNNDAVEVNNLRVSFHEMSHNGFGYDAVEIDAQIIAAADAISSSWQDLGSLSFDVDFGQELVVRFSQSGGQLSSDRLGVYAFNNGGFGHGFPWVATIGTDINGDPETLRKIGMVPLLTLEFDDGTFGMLDGSMPALANSSSGLSSQEVGTKFRVPWNRKIDALGFFGQHDGSGSLDLVLWQGTTEIVSVTIFDVETEPSSVAKLFEVPLQDEIELTENTDYIVAIRPTASNGSVASLVLEDAGHRVLFGDLNIAGVTRATGSDPWSTPSTTSIYLAGVRFSQAQAGAAASAKDWLHYFRQYSGGQA